MDIERKELEKAISLVVPGIARKELFDQADKLAFQDGQLISYNDEVSIFHPLDGSEDIEGAIDGKRLHTLLSKLPDTVPNVVLTPKENELEFKAGRTIVNFAMASVVLPFSEIDWSGEYQELPEGFMEALALVASTCARDMSRPVLTCVHMNKEVMQASDSYRAARFKFESADLPEILLPVTAAEVLTDNKYEINRIAVGENGEWVRFATHDDTVICARVSAGTYPNINQVLIARGDTILLPKGLIESLGRAKVFAKRDHRIDEEVEIELRGKLIVVNSHYDGGRFEEKVRGTQEATAKFSIHPDFLSSALSDTETPSCIIEKSKIKFIGPNWEHIVALR